ncbi:Shedu anti-phage system protein SduA domain-containing protein [Aerosakkonema funiforme]|uniref:Shedu anti-phage system protein SduA domain-containing protein n=1 Tax=Aerosakkonema funiforme TaxID=1246630 RepID=UPI0035B7F0AA
MKNFSRVEFDVSVCRSQLSEMQQLLQSRRGLSERDDIIPFFRERQHLSAFLASYHPDISRYDRVAFEYDIFGDFACDLAIGDSVNRSYCFVEFEEAATNSIFITKPGRSTPEWSSRFERGLSQIIDGFWKLNDLERTDDFENRFNGRTIDYIGLLVVGRDENLELRERKRLEWRRQNTIVNSKHSYFVTYDKLYNDLSYRLARYQFSERIDP